MDSLRHTALRGGAVLAARQGLSLVLNLGGTLALTRLLGPSGYGQAAAALGLATFLFQVGQLGLNAWLVRRPSASAADEAVMFRTARSLLVGAGFVLLAVALLLFPLVSRWLRDDTVRTLALGFALGLPLQLASLVPLAALERRLAYAPVAVAELQSLVLSVGVSVTLAWAGVGPRAIVIGWWLQQLWLFVRYQRAAGIGLAFGLDRALAREGLGAGLAYAGSLWIWQLRELVNPLVVARWAGVEGAGLVALAVRVVDAASVVKAAAWRIALPALAKLAHDAPRLVLAVRDGTRLQLLGVVPALLLLVLLRPLIPLLLGEPWRPVLPLLPVIAAGIVVNASLNLQSSALYARGHAGAVALHHAAYVLLFASAALQLVPRLGVAGYGWAELLALPGYLALVDAFRRHVGASVLREPAFALLVAAAFVAAVWWWWAPLVLALVLVVPALRGAVGETVAAARRGVFARGAA